MAEEFISLARKWRPRRLSDMVGQEYIVRALKNAARDGRMHHALLFSGTRGIGKTTLARIVAMLLNCSARDDDAVEPCLQCDFCRSIMAGNLPDVIEQDAASHTQVDKMREMLDMTKYAPVCAKYKVFIIDEAHMLTKQSFNAMLKTLEEPPLHVKFILATTDPQKLPATVRSRCLCFSLLPLTARQIRERLGHILTREEIPFAPAAAAVIARLAAGSMRDALSILDQAVAHRSGELQTDDVRRITGDIGMDMMADLLRAVAEGNAAAINTLTQQHVSMHISFDSSLQRIAALLYKIALAQAVPAAAEEDSDDVEEAALIKEFCGVFSPPQLQVLYEIALRARQQLTHAPDGATGFCMALLRMILFAPSNEAMPAASSAASSAAPAAASSSVPAAASASPSAAGAAAGNAAAAPAAASSAAPVAATAPAPAEKTNATRRANHAASANSANGAGEVNAAAADSDSVSPQEKWQNSAAALSGVARALAMYCTASRYDEHGVVLTLDNEKAALADKFLPALKADLAKKHGAQFSVQLTTGEDNAAAESHHNALLQKINSSEFMREVKAVFPAAKLIPASAREAAPRMTS